jgi:hypothetical protein
VPPAGWPELIGLAGGLAASGFALARQVTGHLSRLSDRLLAAAESRAQSQDARLDRLAEELNGLSATLAENTRALERAQIRFSREADWR